MSCADATVRELHSVDSTDALSTDVESQLYLHMPVGPRTSFQRKQPSMLAKLQRLFSPEFIFYRERNTDWNANRRTSYQLNESSGTEFRLLNFLSSLLFKPLHSF